MFENFVSLHIGEVLNIMRKRCVYILLYSILPCLFLFSCSKTDDSLSGKVEMRVQQMSEKSEISTVEYTITKVIKADDNAWYKIGDRKILFTCTAYLKAGVDLNNFSMESIQIDEGKKSVVITLPHAELQSINIPPDKVKLAYRRVGVLRKDFTAEERNALVRQGEADILKDVGNMGILQEAEANAVEFFTSAFKQLGFENVQVNFYLKNEKNKL